MVLINNIIKNIITIDDIKQILNHIKNNISDKYPHNIFLNNTDILYKIIFKVLKETNLIPDDYIHYLDFIVYTEPGLEFNWHTDNSDLFLEYHKDIINIGIPLLIKKVKENNYITGIKYVDPNKNNLLYDKIDKNLERPIEILENKNDIENFIINNKIIFDKNDTIIKDCNNKYIIFKNEIIYDIFEHINIGDVILFNSSMLHRTINNINTSRVTMYIKLCKKNNFIKNNISDLYIPSWKISTRIPASIMKYNNDNNIISYMRILKILKQSIIHINIEEIITIESNIIFNYDIYFYIFSLEGDIIIIDKKYSILFNTSNKKSQEIFSYEKNNKIDNNSGIIKLPIKKIVILKIIEFIKYFYKNNINENNINKNNINENNINENNINEWYINFIDVNSNLYLKNSNEKIHIFEILFSSNYIGIKYLYDLICYKISKLINKIDLTKLPKIEVYINNSYPHKKIKNTIINYINSIHNIDDLYINDFNL
jgi:hypothetical protein